MHDEREQGIAHDSGEDQSPQAGADASAPSTAQGDGDSGQGGEQSGEQDVIANEAEEPTGIGE